MVPDPFYAASQSDFVQPLHEVSLISRSPNNKAPMRWSSSNETPILRILTALRSKFQHRLAFKGSIHIGEHCTLYFWAIWPNQYVIPPTFGRTAFQTLVQSFNSDFPTDFIIFSMADTQSSIKSNFRVSPNCGDCFPPFFSRTSCHSGTLIL